MKENLLQSLKDFSVVDEMLAEFPLKKLESACAAWSLCNAEIMDMEEYTDDPFTLWKHCKFDKDKWIRMLSFIPPGGFLYKLIHSNLIYPDGGYNRDWLSTKRIAEAMKGTGHGKQRRDLDE